MKQPLRFSADRARAQRGLGLIDALAALVILAFGMLSLTRMQARVVAQSTEAQQRVQAVAVADNLLGFVAVDAANAACYQIPAGGTCGSPAAAAHASSWAASAVAMLPSAAASAVLDANGTFTVHLRWQGKETQDNRRLEVTTDVRQ
jgi:type IV pilus assembly protein PilV